ncbi:YCF48-related protein [Paenibacillus dokdonensis]|uniref:YCF48-related protein n=1 Tax=Paenibacillus dokdonensis TaxID=2567944 RepID=A0ABU6GT22_9BACL|nr:YCF48-related protein [Paenibacillus dokdonensis]MEC0242262.1 YCF48-related protein [Paenibacillus dokdonensis]
MKIHRLTVQAAAILAIVSLLLSACSYSNSDQTASSGEVRIVKMTQTASNITADQHVTLQKAAPVIINNPVSNYDIPVIDFVTDNTGFAVKEKYGESLTLIATTDGGKSWTEKKLPGQFVRSLDFIDSNTGWLLIEEGCSLKNGMTACSKLRLLKTQNGGTAWTTQWQASSKENRIHSFTNLRRLSFQDSKNGVMLANGNLYVTSDGGSHFKATAFGLKDFTPLSMSFPKGQTGYVTGNVGKDAGKLAVLKTSNRGRTWQKQLEIKAKESPVSSLGIQFMNENTGWLLTNDTGMMSGEIYRTIDGGKHWKTMSTQRTGRPTPTDIQLADADIGMISLHPGAGPIEGGIWLTMDGGKSFTSVAPNHVTAVNQLQMLSADHIWAAADDMNQSGYLLHSSDGGRTWKQSYPKSVSFGSATPAVKKRIYDALQMEGA